MQRRRFLQGATGAGLLLVAGLPSGLRAQGVKPDGRAALIVVDVQNCFLPGGTLPVKDGDQVIPVINRLATVFPNVIVTQDWHTPRHASFASAHDGKKPFETTDLSYGTQVLWPDHCVQGSRDAELAAGLDGYLKSRGIDTVYVTGLATDFCVAWTAMDARSLGFEAFVIEDATRAIDLDGSLAKAWQDMTAKGVRRIRSGDILG